MVTNPVNGISMKQLDADTKSKQEYVKALGYNLIVMRECHWKDLIQLDPDVRNFITQLQFRTMSENIPMTECQIIDALSKNKFFGLIECDISVPEHLKEKFSEMQPIFKNVMVTRECLSEHMKQFAEQSGHLKSGQRMLIGSMFGKKILLLTSLARWYLDQGLIISKVYQIVQFKPVKCFETFGNSVSDARRAGDVDPTKTLLAETSKLVGNSCYGRMISNKEKHREISFTESDRKASCKIKSSRFISMDELCDGFYELTLEKQRITLDTPVILGFAVLQYAKLRMLQFYYEFIDRFVSREDFEYIEMDTDSAYMALSGSLNSIIKPEMKDMFFACYGEWFPKPYCSSHQQDFIANQKANKEWKMETCCQKQYNIDKRTPGLFKEEFVGNGIVALNSKTYFCWSESNQKYSTKGINKRLNIPTREQFLDVIKTQNPVSGLNRGFIKKNNAIYTYSQLRTGLTYFYAKRKVCTDGVSTLPTDM